MSSAGYKKVGLVITGTGLVIFVCYHIFRKWKRAQQRDQGLRPEILLPLDVAMEKAPDNNEKSTESLTKEPQLLLPIDPKEPFNRSPLYIENILEIRRILEQKIPLDKDLMLKIRRTIVELIFNQYLETHKNNIIRRRPLLENINNWSKEYLTSYDELNAIVERGECDVVADLGITIDEYRDLHRSLLQRDHQYSITSLKMVEGIKMRLQRRSKNPLTKEEVGAILTYQLKLAKDIPYEAFHANNIKKSMLKRHIIKELAYMKFDFDEGDLSSEVFDDRLIKEKQLKIQEEFLGEIHQGLAFP